MSINRRTFLQSMGAGAVLLGSGAFPRRVRAAGEDRYFIFAYFSGGWDTLLCLDPRDPGEFPESRINETRIQLAWDRLPAGYDRSIIQPSGSNITFGPTMGGIAPHFEKLSIVRGMSMDTVTHEVGRRYMLTGMVPRGRNAAGSSMGTRIAAQQGNLRAIPNLVSRVETYNEGDPVFATGLAVNGTSALVQALRDGPQAPRGAVRTRLDEYRARAANCDPAALNKDGMFTLIRETQSKARDLVSSDISRLFNFNDQANPEIAALRQRYGITNGNAITPGTQAALAFQAIKNDVAQSVTIEIQGGLDTHDDSWEDDHPDRLAAGFSALGQLVTDLEGTEHAEGGSLLSRTTIVAFSEFGRTALINSRGGRDHALNSSCLLIGAGVPHNQVIGASSDSGMNPMPVNPTSGVAEPGGVILNPNLVLASVIASAGFSTEQLRTAGLPALMV